MEAASLKKRLVLFPNQAVSIYDYTNFNLRYADGFEIFGMKNEEITMLDIFNTAIPEHREVCGELSGKLIKLAKENVIDPDLHLLNITYAGQHKNGDKMHILLQGKIFDVTRDEKIKSACTIMTYLPHLKPPKIVSWSVHGSSLNNIDELLDKNIVNNHHIREREKEILILISDGQTMNEIGNDILKTLDLDLIAKIPLSWSHLQRISICYSAFICNPFEYISVHSRYSYFPIQKYVTTGFIGLSVN